MIAPQKGRADVIRLLLQNQADVNIRDKVHGVSALFMAAQNGQTETVKRLLEKGAEVNVQAKSNQATPLIVAYAQGHIWQKNSYLSRRHGTFTMS